MTSLFSFKGRIPRLWYALLSAGAFFSQHLVAFTVDRMQQAPLPADFVFYVMPLRSMVTCDPACGARHISDLMLILALAYGLIVAWVLAALAFRRAADANIEKWIAAAAIVPVIQIPAILLLCVLPPRSAGESAVGEPALEWTPAAQGVIAGIGLTLAAVAISTLGFGVYGYGLFVASPFIIGAITAYLANRKMDIGAGATMRLVSFATLLSGLALVVASLEGIICIVLAAPLGLGAALIGGLLGRAVAVRTRRPASQALSSFAVLPVVFALESVLPATTSFDTRQTIMVNAPPEVVWKSIIKMDTMDEPLALPFRLGVAHPLRGEVMGEGVDAVRYGEFSTGIAVERVTEWVLNRKLAFVVEKDVPSMHELSPYEHVHAPHAIGYFRTSYTSFELLQRPDGGTEIVELTSHQLRLDPAFYWLPMARWIVNENNARVLAHIRRQAERSFR